MKKKTIKEMKQEMISKYGQYIKYISVYRNRDYWTSGPNTGKGSKGTYYIYTYSTSVKKGTKSYAVFENSWEKFENAVINAIQLLEEMK